MKLTAGGLPVVSCNSFYSDALIGGILLTRGTVLPKDG